MKKLLTKHVKWFIHRTTVDRLDSTSAHGAFFLIISLLPFLAFLLTLMQQIHFAGGSTLIEMGLRVFPDSVADYLRELLPDPFTSGTVMPVAVIAAIWSSSMGMLAIIQGLDQIYRSQDNRGFIRLRLMAVLYVVVFALVVLVVAALLVFGSTIYAALLKSSPPFFATLLMNFKSLAGFILLFAFFMLLYTFVPRRHVKFLHNLAGAAFSAGGWVLFSFFFSLFVENFANFSIYGGLATLVIFMFWLFFCMYILFLGAEVSMWLETSGIGEDISQLRRRRRHQKNRKKAQTQSTKKK